MKEKQLVGLYSTRDPPLASLFHRAILHFVSFPGDSFFFILPIMIHLT